MFLLNQEEETLLKTETDIDSFKVLEPLHDAFRNWLNQIMQLIQKK